MGTGKNHNQYRFDRLTHDTDRSAMAKYKELIVGQGSWGQLVTFELITGLLGGMPGHWASIYGKSFSRACLNR